jgi:hypothetical protein
MEERLPREVIKTELHARSNSGSVFARRIFLAFVLSVGLVLSPVILCAQSVSFGWNPSADTNVAGYMLYLSTDGVNFSAAADAGTNISVTVTGLQPGSTNYFAVVSYDTNSNQSLPSPSIEYVTPSAGDFSVAIEGAGTLSPKTKATSLQPGRKYTLVATPAKGSLFAGWVSNGVVVATGKSFTLTVQPGFVLQVDFVHNPFDAIAGTYHGLLYATTNAAGESSGSFLATVTSTGSYSAKLRFGSGSYSLSGVLSPFNGAISKTINRRGMTPLAVDLQLDLSGGVFTGTISDGDSTAEVLAYAAVYSKKNRLPEAGKYTMLIPGSNDASSQPGGNGFASLIVNSLGNLTFSGTLGDGTQVSGSGVITASVQWPFYASVYGGKGSILGWLDFSIVGTLSGETVWFKPPIPGSKFYPEGFTNNAAVTGSIYQYTNNVPVLGSDQATLLLTNGDLSAIISNSFIIPLKAGTKVGAGETKVTVVPSTGEFKTSVLNPETGKEIPLSGVILQNQDFGAGLFLGSDESGSVVLIPSP